MALQRRSRSFGFFGALFCLFTLVFSCVIGWSFYKQWRASGEYVAVEATVESSQVEEHTTSSKKGGTSRSYKVHVVYSYSYQGTGYTSDRFRFASEPSYSSRDVAEGVMQLYVPGSTVTAYVDPANPTDVVLDKECNWGNLFIVVPVLLAFFGVGCLFMYLGFSKVKYPAREAAVAEILRKKPAVVREGYFPLAMASRQRIAKFAIAVIWNVITWVFFVVFLADPKARQGSPAWVYAVIGLFVVVGLGMLWFMVVAEWILARQFRPPTLSISHTPISLGDAFSVQYKQTVTRAMYLQSIVVKLVHTEEYWVRRGKNNSRQINVLWSDPHTFDIEAMCQPGQQFDFAESFTIPAGMNCSMNYNNRDYLWKFEVVVRVKSSPDYKAEFPLEVFPHRETGV